MDPNTALAVARRAAQEILSGRFDSDTVTELVRAVEALDVHLSKGGYLPDDWRKGRPGTTWQPSEGKGEPMFAERFRGTLEQCQQYIKDRGWDRPTKTAGIPQWELKKDGITQIDGEQAYLILTNW